MARSLIFVLGLIAMLQWAGPAVAVDLPKPVQDAQILIESKAPVIVWQGHHISGNETAEYDGAIKLNGGYALTFTFRFTGGFSFSAWTKVKFLVNNNGKVIALDVVDKSWSGPDPWEGDLTQHDIKVRREALKKHPMIKNSLNLLQKVGNANAKEMTLLFLNLELGKETAAAQLNPQGN